MDKPFGLVGAEGLEPSLLLELEPKSSVSAISPRAPENNRPTDPDEDSPAHCGRMKAPLYFASSAFASVAGASSLISSTQTHCRSTIFAASPLRVNSLRMRV